MGNSVVGLAVIVKHIIVRPRSTGFYFLESALDPLPYIVGIDLSAARILLLRSRLRLELLAR